MRYPGAICQWSRARGRSLRYGWDDEGVGVDWRAAGDAEAKVEGYVLVVEMDNESRSCVQSLVIYVPAARRQSSRMTCASVLLQCNLKEAMS